LRISRATWCWKDHRAYFVGRKRQKVGVATSIRLRIETGDARNTNAVIHRWMQIDSAVGGRIHAMGASTDDWYKGTTVEISKGDSGRVRATLVDIDRHRQSYSRMVGQPSYFP
jgi:hypothetical protein